MARMYLNSISLSICFSYIKFEFFFALKAGEARVNGKNVSQTFGSGRCRVRRNVATVLSLSLSVSLSLCVCVCVCVCACVYKYVHISGGTERWAEVHHGVWTSVYAKTRTVRAPPSLSPLLIPLHPRDAVRGRHTRRLLTLD